MSYALPSQSPNELVIIAPNQFSDWYALNDSIMGGSSHASCINTNHGLILEGELVEEGGGFVSCRSPVISPPLNLIKYRGLQLEVEWFHL